MMKQVIEKNKEYLKNDAIEEYQQSLEDRLRKIRKDCLFR